MDNTSFKNFYDENGYVIAKSLINKEIIEVLIDLKMQAWIKEILFPIYTYMGKIFRSYRRGFFGGINTNSHKTNFCWSFA